ncbi:hypothetical protein ACS3SW_07695 [Roseobacteraceae bacterium S113]
MSDPAKTVEIEDVLASIRRLVSDEVAQELGRVDAPPTTDDAMAEAGAPAQAPADALVLTPSLRVHDGGQSGESATEANAADGAETSEDLTQDDHIAEADAPEADTSNSAQDALLQAVAEQMATLDDTDADNDTDTGNETDSDYETGEDATDAGAVESPLEDSDDALSPEAEQALAGMVDASEATIVESEPEIIEDVVPTASMDNADMTDSEAEPQTDEASEEAEPFILETAVDASSVDEPHVQEAETEDASSIDAYSLEAKIAKLESMIGEQEWEDEAANSPTLEWEDAAPQDAPSPEIAPEPETEPAPTIAQVKEAKEPTSDLFAEPGEVVLDEDMLRDMVTAIVREELQGSLGERITRNVRKLVRREIHRALASHELE